MKFISDKEIEEITLKRISEFEKKYGVISFPVPLDLIIEKIFNLRIDWDSLGQGVLGGLNPQQRLLAINEDYDDFFKAKPGLERFTKAHELGHWDLHVEEAQLSHPSLFDEKGTEVFLQRNTQKGNSIYSIKSAWLDPEIYKKEQAIKHDTPFIARQVEKYASFLLMPTHLIKKYVSEVGEDIYNWPALYKMAELFAVTISALKVRLTRMGLIYVSEDFSDKRIYHSKDEWAGQCSLL
jgi:Zn-dependent peptidase ImmA (M78 family)